MHIEVIHDGDNTRYLYQNINGELSFCENDGYAILEVQTDEYGRIIREFCYDENEKPIQQRDGQYGLERHYDELGQNTIITYLGVNGKPQEIYAGYATVIREFNQIGQVTKEMYFDKNGIPVENQKGEYGLIKEYNSEELVKTIISVDKEGNPTVNEYGYSYVRYNYSSEKKSLIEKYYGMNNEPSSGRYGEFGVNYEFGDDETSETFLNEDGNSKISSLGYATKKTIKQKNSEIELYYDEMGNPVALSHGQYGLKRSRDSVYYLNSNGKCGFYWHNVLTILQHDILIVMLIVLILCMLFCYASIRIKWVLLVFYIVAILLITLAFRKNYGFELTPFWSYKLFWTDKRFRTEILNNILLFIPLGMGLFTLNGNRNSKLLYVIPFLFSTVIETTQYLFECGICEVDDIISNTIGAMLGIIVAKSFLELGFMSYGKGELIKMEDFNELFNCDTKRYDGGPKGWIKRYLYYFRKSQTCKNRVLNYYYRFVFRRISQSHGMEISRSVKIGKGLYIGHPYNITINENAILGDNINIHKGVTIGQENRGIRKGTPVIGNEVWIGVNATIVGAISIGNDVLIAPNTYVNCNVPDHSVVFGNPCQIKYNMNATEGYINRKVEL